MSVIRVEVNKDKFASLPAAEQTLFLGVAHLYNEVNATTKLLYWAATTPTGTEAQDHGRLSLLLMLIQLLAGKLNEGWELFTKAYFGSVLSREFEPALDASGREALQYLKRYFGKANEVNVIRNKFAFHYTPHELETVLPHVTEPLYAYMEADLAPNNLFFFSEAMTAQALVRVLSSEVRTRSFEELVETLFEVAASFAIASDAIMDAILTKSGHDLRVGQPVEVVLSGPLDFRAVPVPWFTDTSGVDKVSLGSA